MSIGCLVASTDSISDLEIISPSSISLLSEFLLAETRRKKEKEEIIVDFVFDFFLLKVFELEEGRQESIYRCKYPEVRHLKM